MKIKHIQNKQEINASAVYCRNSDLQASSDNRSEDELDRRAENPSPFENTDTLFCSALELVMPRDGSFHVGVKWRIRCDAAGMAVR